MGDRIELWCDSMHLSDEESDEIFELMKAMRSCPRCGVWKSDFFSSWQKDFPGFALAFDGDWRCSVFCLNCHAMSAPTKHDGGVVDIARQALAAFKTAKYVPWLPFVQPLDEQGAG